MGSRAGIPRYCPGSKNCSVGGHLHRIHAHFAVCYRHEQLTAVGKRVIQIPLRGNANQGDSMSPILGGTCNDNFSIALQGQTSRSRIPGTHAVGEDAVFAEIPVKLAGRQISGYGKVFNGAVIIFADHYYFPVRLRGDGKNLIFTIAKILDDETILTKIGVKPSSSQTYIETQNQAQGKSYHPHQDLSCPSHFSPPD
ncbi:MAG: hypothetical protein ACD_75C00184G0001 [uncultured bacterium]|nr:MAG: hypothetical protein ACD_75C00184G0001 [uncultured bacterium]